MQSLVDRLTVPVLTVLISLFIFFGFVKFFGPIPFTVNSINTQKTDLFSVNGTGEATGIPDTAQFTVGVTKTAGTVEDAQNQVNQAVSQITSALKEQGIADKDIKTADYTVNPNVDFTSGRQTTTGYTVSTNINVTLKDATKANKALDSATANGANIVNGVSFILNDEERQKLEDKARAEAIKKAKEQAVTISQQAGLRLGRIINVTVNPTNPGPIAFDKMSAAPAGLGGGEPTQLQPGENKVTVTVTLSYETL